MEEIENNKIPIIGHKARLQARAKASLQASNFTLVIRVLGALAMVIVFAIGSFMQLNFDAYAEQADIVEISNAEELKTLADFVNQGRSLGEGYSYKLTQDIDLADLNSLDEEGWQPIGFKAWEEAIAFNGVFDGNGFAVRGLWINKTNYGFGSGLFGYSKGTIKNLTIEIDEAKGGVNAKNYVGGVAGINEGNIENCAVKGKVFAEIYAGGMVGENKGTVSSCTSYASIEAEMGAGGIAGGNFGEIKLCQNVGTVEGEEHVGGLVGVNVVAQSKIVSCANYGRVSGITDVGGLSGYTLGKVWDCFNSGSISGLDSVGGAAGFCRAEIKNFLNTGIVTGETNSGAVVGQQLANSTTNSYYLLGTGEGEGGDEEKTVNELTTRSFLEKLNVEDTIWFLRTPDNFHYFPEIKMLANDLSKQYTTSQLPAYKGVPVLSGYTLTYGEALSTLSFASNNAGIFAWQEPDKILSAGSQTAYASFIPNSLSFGQLYDNEIVITVLKAQSIISVSMDGWKERQNAINPVITITAGERAGSDLIIEYKKRSASDNSYTKALPKKSGKYTVRIFYEESDNYLASYAEYDFEILPDLTWLWILAIVAAALMLIVFTVYLTDKKFGYIKKVFVKEVVREVIVETPIYVQPEINTTLLDECFERLTTREIEVARKILEGKTRKQIAAELVISERTAKSHIENILQKTECANQRVFALKFKT